MAMEHLKSFACYWADLFSFYFFFSLLLILVIYSFRLIFIAFNHIFCWFCVHLLILSWPLCSCAWRLNWLKLHFVHNHKIKIATYTKWKPTQRELKELRKTIELFDEMRSVFKVEMWWERKKTDVTYEQK